MLLWWQQNNKSLLEQAVAPLGIQFENAVTLAKIMSLTGPVLFFTATLDLC